MRFRERRPGLVVEFNDFSHCLFVELAFDHKRYRTPFGPQGRGRATSATPRRMVFFRQTRRGCRGGRAVDNAGMPTKPRTID